MPARSTLCLIMETTEFEMFNGSAVHLGHKKHEHQWELLLMIAIRIERTSLKFLMLNDSSKKNWVLKEL